MADALKTGLSGLLTFQRAIATTSHNIANANTEGYSRQRLDLSARPTTATGFGYIGHGVQIDSVERIQDIYTQTRLEQMNSEAARTGTYHEMISRIDNLLADDSASLTPVLNDFFNAIQDVNSNPSSTASRQALLGAATNLAGRFSTLQSQFDYLQGEVNSRIASDVNDVNTIAANIAELNEQIVTSTAQAGGHPPNDLLDKRDQLLSQLSEYTSITTLKQDNGAVNIFIGNGLNLVVNNRAETLVAVQDPGQPDKSQLALVTPNGNQYVSDKLTGGSLGGLMDFRREALDPMMNQLGQVAVTLADGFNQQHAAGLDLNGAVGGEFFRFAQPEVIATSANTGSGVVDASFTDTTALTASDYRLSYDGSNYTLTRLSDNTQVTGAMPISMDGLELTLTGAPAAGDSFVVRPTRKAARDFALAITDPNKIALAAPLRSEAPVSNLGTASVTPPETLDFSDPNFNDTVEIRFNNPPTTFDVVNTTSGATLASGVTYTDGDNVAYQGWQVQISGAVAAGDVFRIEPNGGAAGNNRNGMALAEIQNALLVGGTTNVQQGFAGMISHIGSQTRQAEINSQAMAGLQSQAREARESVSGVNLDEEAINLTRFQQAYQAAAQVISTADNMFQTLIGAIGR